MAKITTPAKTVSVQPLRVERLECYIAGVSGLYCHRMTAKASRDLLVGGRKKTAADKKQIKHHPRAEFEASMFLTGRPPTPYVEFPAGAIKRALRTAAIESEGITGASVDRLLWVEDERIPIHGMPLLRMDVVRSADVGRTPDVRTRAYFPAWASKFTISYTGMTISDITTLLQNAGHIVGIGDFRQEKGRGAYGRWAVVSEAEFKGMTVKHAAQKAAVEAAMPDTGHGDTATLLTHYDDEVAKR